MSDIHSGGYPGGTRPSNLKADSHYEEMGVHRAGPNVKPTVQSGPSQPKATGHEDGTFNPLAPGYAGPDRITNNAKNEGVKNPDDVKRG